MPTLYPYSVLLLYPDYLTDGRTEIRFDHVMATTPDLAIETAQMDVAKGDAADARNFIPLLVLEGHHVQPVWTDTAP